MKLSVLIFLFCFGLISPSLAEISCNEDFRGHKKCSGTNSLGEFVQTDSYKDISGVVYTSGQVGADEVNIRTDFNPLGEPKTSGRIGQQNVGADMFFNTQYGASVRRLPIEAYTNINHSVYPEPVPVRSAVSAEQGVKPVLPAFQKPASPVRKRKAADIYTTQPRDAEPVAIVRDYPERVYIYEPGRPAGDNEYIRRPRY